MNRTTVLLILILAGTMCGLLVHWTTDVNGQWMKASCEAKQGYVDEIDGVMTCVRKST